MSSSVLKTIGATTSASTVNLPTSNTEQWLAQFSGEFNEVNGRTVMGKTQHYGPLRVQRPFFPEGPSCLHFYLLHPPGGLVGGDRLSIQLNATERAHLLMTTPSAGKIYRNVSGFTQGQFVDISVGNEAVVEYLPQENIVFNGANGELRTDIEISGSGIFIGWDITCLGRFESGDHFEQGQLKQSLKIQQDGRPLFMDSLNLSAPSSLQSGRPGLQGLNVFATFVINRDIMNEALETELIEWQQTLNSDIAPAKLAFTQKPNVFVARMLSDKSEQVKHVFESLWARLRPIVINKQPMPPRIWRT